MVGQYLETHEPDPQGPLEDAEGGEDSPLYFLTEYSCYTQIAFKAAFVSKELKEDWVFNNECAKFFNGGVNAEGVCVVWNSIVVKECLCHICALASTLPSNAESEVF